jgi:hypothetical protein
VPHFFPRNGNYEIQVWLARDRNELIEGLTEPHELEVLVDNERVAVFAIRPPDDEDDRAVDANLRVRAHVTAGPHRLGVTFIKQPTRLLETKRQPYEAHFNMHRHPRIGPAIYQISITGPFDASAPGNSPSRQRLLVCHPNGPDDELACAQQILRTLLRRAYRRPVNEVDLSEPLKFYSAAHAAGGFEAGIEAALAAVLVNPQFLFRIERDPSGLPAGTVYRISDVELASRLSFFLWSSMPDDELLALAERNELNQPAVLEPQVRRMLADDRARSLATNFAGQWLHLRNLDAATPDLRLYPDFDDNLRQAMRRETELLFEEVQRQDLNVLELLQTDHTFLNQRLARHYGIPHVYGSRFRRVELDGITPRGGLLRHGSILTVTSYATRTSPVIRGQWVLKNLLGAAPPPPPPDVPALEDNRVAANLPMRARLAAHRTQAACANCHHLMDPIGLAMENFDAVGRWRDLDQGETLDVSGSLPDGSQFVGVDGLEQSLLAHPERFVATMTEKLMVFALGRAIEPYDAPAVRQIVREARANGLRFSSLILGIVRSVPFQMREVR